VRIARIEATPLAIPLAQVIVQGGHDAGGLLRLRQQAFLCDALGLRLNLHAFMQSEISFLAHAQVAATYDTIESVRRA
jgi:L-alanine-DL-glutamate epimerase-like enolase superfamily enzyme